MHSHIANKGHICTWGFHGSKLFLVAIRHIISRLYTCSMHSTTCICLVYAISWWAVAPSTFFPSTWMNVGMIVNGDSFFWRVGNTCLSICKDQYIRVFTSAWFYATLKFWTGIIYPWRYIISNATLKLAVPGGSCGCCGLLGRRIRHRCAMGITCLWVHQAWIQHSSINILHLLQVAKGLRGDED